MYIIVRIAGHVNRKANEKQNFIDRVTSENSDGFLSPSDGGIREVMMEKGTEKTWTLIRVLREELAGGLYPEGSRFPSEYDLAERFGVHKSTANKAVSILTAEGLLARGARGAGTRVLRRCRFPRGILGFVGSLNHAYPTAVLRGMQKMALAHGYLTTVFSPSQEEEADCLELLPGSGIAGAVICRSGLLFRDSTLPVVHVDSDTLLDYTGLHGVDSDKYAGARMILAEACRCGRRNIALYVRKHRHTSSWLAGFLDEMESQKIGNPRDRVFTAVECTDCEARQNLRRMMERLPGLNMIACDSDERAELIAEAAMTEHIDCPGRIALSGAGNLPGIGKRWKFSSLEQHPSQIGSTACASLIELVEGRIPEAPVREYIPPSPVNFFYMRRQEQDAEEQTMRTGSIRTEPPRGKAVLIPPQNRASLRSPRGLTAGLMKKNGEKEK